MGVELDLMHGAGEQVRHTCPVRDAQLPGGHGYGPRSVPRTTGRVRARVFFEMTAASDSLPG